MGRVSQQEARAETRRRLIDAAGWVFSEKGFAGASLEEIAEAAGFTRGAVYYNFSGKDELFIAVLDQRLAHETAIIGELVEHSGDVHALVEGLRKRGATRQSAAEAEKWMQLSGEFWLYALRNPAARERLAEHHRHLRAAYAKAITALLGQWGIAPPAPVEQLAALIFALDSDLPRQGYLDPQAVPAVLFTDLLELLVRAAAALDATEHPHRRGR